MSRMRERSGELRQALPSKASAATPPEERGKRLATLRRGDSEELRLAWQEYQGRPFLSVRLWTRDDAGSWWPDKARGFTVRVRELADFADGVAAAVEEAEAFAERERQANAEASP